MRTYLEHDTMTLTQVAKHHGVNGQNIGVLLNVRASLTAIMALRFEESFGVSADTLRRMKAGNDLAQERGRKGRLVAERMRKGLRGTCGLSEASPQILVKLKSNDANHKKQ